MIRRDRGQHAFPGEAKDVSALNSGLNCGNLRHPFGRWAADGRRPKGLWGLFHTGGSLLEYVGAVAEGMRKIGAVTRTQIGRAQSGDHSSGLGSGSGFHVRNCFVSEDAERVGGCEIALDVEDRGVNRQEALA
jgi:hypothetical protein